ncbi:MAG: SIS domain-containing protein [Bacteroidota bacterium]
MPSSPASAYLDAATAILDDIRTHELDAIDAAAEVCADAIAQRGLVHLFGTGHSRIMIEEMFPRHGSYAGFHPIVELSLTFHNPVVGSNGQRQAMFLEHVKGFASTILRNFVIAPPDCFVIVSNSGVNEVVVEMAMEAKALGCTVIALVSKDHCARSAAKHSSGQKLPDIADITLGNGTPGGDALVAIDGMDEPVGPGSTVGGAAVINALKCQIAHKLAARDAAPIVLSSGLVIGSEASKARFDVVYDDYRERMKKVYG